MQNLALSWLVYRLTHSTAYLGAISFSQQIPVLLLALPAGGVVDRTDRHRMVILTQTLALFQAGILAVLTYSGKVTISQLFFLSILLGVISAFDLPARQAFLVQMVGKDDLMNAIALNSSMFNAARMIGPAIAGFLVTQWGEALCFLLNAASYLAILIALLKMKMEVSPNERQQSLGEDLAEGFRFIRDTAPVRALLLLLGSFGIGGFSFSVLLPVFADRVFFRGAEGLGWLMTATGIGALAGALFLAGRKGIQGISKLISFSAFVFPTGLILFSLCTHFSLAFLLLCFVGFFMMVTIAAINTAIQSIIPDTLRGRVMSFFTTMLMGMAPIGSLLSGFVAKYLGVQATVFAFSLVCLAAAFWFYRSLPKIQLEAQRLYLLQNPTIGESIP